LQDKPVYLTKSLFTTGIRCPKAMWLDAWQNEGKAPLSRGDQERIRTGGVIGEMALNRYPGGIKLERGHEPNSGLTPLQQGAPAVFEACFLHDNCLIRVDALWQDATGLHLDEVKSSTAKDPTILRRNGKVHDLAFQWHVLNRAGIQLQSSALVLIDRSYIWEAGDHDPHTLLARVDLTEECKDLEEEIAAKAEELKEHLFKGEPPQIATNKHCGDCAYYDHCHKGQIAHDVVFLPRIKAPQVTKLRVEGYASIDRIPDTYELPPEWAKARESVLTGKPVVDPGLHNALSEIALPAAFIDFESCMPALPIYPGTKPYDQICFQWSAHTLDKKRQLSHSEYLHEGPDDPRPAFCRSLWEAVKGCETLVSYTDFEISRLREMAQAGIPYAEELHELMASGQDLHRIVRDYLYCWEFKGSTSIKKVLPVLVPSMSYEGMGIADGGTAAVAYLEMLQAPPEQAEVIKSDLLAYCKLDTRAMVEIYFKLLELAKPAVEKSGQMTLQF
jgi:hypothetical protein